jgi:hypothetical protein
MAHSGEMHYEESDYHQAVHIPSTQGNLSLSLYLPSATIPLDSLVPYILSASFVFPAIGDSVDLRDPGSWFSLVCVCVCVCMYVCMDVWTYACVCVSEREIVSE